MTSRYAHPQQRSSRLWHGDTLFQLVDRIPYPPRPEPIPFGEAREMQWPTQPFPVSWSEPAAAVVCAVVN